MYKSVIGIIFGISATITLLSGCGVSDNNPTNTTPEIINQKPIAVISPANEQSIIVGTSINFDGSASSDPDSNEPLSSYKWTFVGVATSLQTSIDEVPGQVTFSEEGVVTVGLVVTDSLGLDSDLAIVTVNILPEGANLPPTGSAISHDNGNGTTDSSGNISIIPGTDVVFNGSATDPEGDALTYTWVFGEGATPPSSASTVAAPGDQPIPITVKYPTAGTFQVELIVTDSKGQADLTPAKLTVTVADAPDGVISHNIGSGTGDINITLGTDVIFTGSVTTPASDLTYNWVFEFEGTISDTTAGSGPITVNYSTVGTYKAILTVTDNATGQTDPLSAEVTITVVAAQVITPPDGIISHDNGNGTTGSTGDLNITLGTNGSAAVIFKGSVSGAPVNNFTYNWEFIQVTPTPSTTTGTGTGTSTGSGAGSDPITVNYTTVGTYKAKLTVTDTITNIADPSPAELTITVVAAQVITPPDGIISHDNGNGTTGSTGDINITLGTNGSAAVIFKGSVSGAPVNNFTYNWEFIQVSPTSSTTTGTSTGSGAGSDPITVNYTTVGTYKAILTVKDTITNIADPSPAEVTITVVAAQVITPPDGIISHDNGNGTPGSTGDINITLGPIDVNGTDVVFSGSVPARESDSFTYNWEFIQVTPTSSTITGTSSSTGTGAGSDPITVNYTTVGTYKAILTVTDINGVTDPSPAEVTVNVTANSPPDGTFSHDNGNGTAFSTGDFSIVAGTSVVFDSAVKDSDNDPITYAWVFEGGLPATSDVSGPITIKYENSGVYTASLTVSDNKGNTTVLTPVTISIMPKFKHLTVLPDEDKDNDPTTATYTLNVNDNVSVNIASPEGNWTTPMMRYNSMQLPPAIKAARGDKITVNVTNNIADEATTVHWHGFKIPGKQDGGPNIEIGPGASKQYAFDILQPAASLWFHPHADGTTATQVYNGLAGAFIVTDDITDSLESNNQIPSGDHDIPLLIQDRSFNPDNGNGVRTLKYNPPAGGMMGGGMMGDRVLVNGVEMPVLAVDTRQYRFRLYNGSNARPYDFSLDNGATFFVIGTDGGLLAVPVSTNHIVLSAGERIEIVVDFRNIPIGQKVMLVSSNSGGGMMGGGSPFNVMRFDVNTAATKDPVILYRDLAKLKLPSTPEILARLKTANPVQIDGPRIFDMTGGGMGGGMGGTMTPFVINGIAYDATNVNETVPWGATEIWEIRNNTMMAHPFHAHAIQWQILERGPNPTLTNPVPIGGLTPASGVDLGWVDTVLVQSGETVRIIGHFDPVINVGLYMYHCHILEHEENGMMGIFNIVDPATIIP